jgi:hypothetical protein
MATVYITEFCCYGIDNLGRDTILPKQVPTAEQTVAIGGTSTQSAALDPMTTLVRVHTDAICSVSFGTNPTATATKMRMAAGTTEYFTVQQNSGLKVAVITNT